LFGSWSDDCFSKALRWGVTRQLFENPWSQRMNITLAATSVAGDHA
jgi:hypothetical protein